MVEYWLERIRSTSLQFDTSPCDGLSWTPNMWRLIIQPPWNPKLLDMSTKNAVWQSTVIVWSIHITPSTMSENGANISGFTRANLHFFGCAPRVDKPKCHVVGYVCNMSHSISRDIPWLKQLVVGFIAHDIPITKTSQAMTLQIEKVGFAAGVRVWMCGHHWFKGIGLKIHISINII